MCLELSNTIFNYRNGQLLVYQQSKFTTGTDEIDSTSNIDSIDVQSNLNQDFSTSGITIQFIVKKHHRWSFSTKGDGMTGCISDANSAAICCHVVCFVINSF